MIKISKKLIVTSIISLAILFSIITCRINYLRVSENKEPILVFKNAAIKDGGTRYYGLGYQIIHWGTYSSPHKYEMSILIFYKIYL